VDGVCYGFIERVAVSLREGEHCLTLQAPDRRSYVGELVLTGETLSLPGARVTCWPNRIWEAELPFLYPRWGGSEEQIAFDGGEACISDAGVRVMREGACRFFHPLPGRSRVRITDGVLRAEGAYGSERVLVLMDIERDEVLLERRAGEIHFSRDERRVALITHIPGESGALQEIFTLQGECLGRTCLPLDECGTVRRFAYALFAGEDCRAFLAPSLAADASPEELREFFGTVDALREPTLYPHEGHVMMFGRREGALLRLTPYGFDVDAGGMIENFYEC
jgi:hypothetical protein